MEKSIATTRPRFVSTTRFSNAPQRGHGYDLSVKGP
jgi:hypothetical protein